MRNTIFYFKITISSICALIALCTSSVCWSTTYYVDATGGNDSNAGTATNSAWMTISKINTSSFSAGDQILFKSGEVWREQLSVPSSGSAGNPITFGKYGTGALPNIDGSGSRTRTVQVSGKSYVTISYIQFTGSATSNSGSVSIYNSNHVIIDHISVHGNIGLAGIVIEGTGGSNTVSNSTVYNTTHADYDRGCGIILDGTAGSNTITNNTIYSNSADGIKLAMFTATSSNTISGNTIYLNGAAGISINASCANNIVQNNKVYSNGRLVADCYGIDLFKVGNNNVVRYNTTYNHNYRSLDAGGIRFDGEPGAIFGTGNKIYYNLIYNERNGIHLLGCSNATVYNNTIYNSGVTGIWNHGSYANNNTFKNNIVHTAGTSLVFNNDATNSVYDYNDYYDTTMTNKFNWNGTASSTLAAWRASSNQDVHSISSDPEFVTAGSDFRLLSTSLSINAGTNVLLTTDYSGNSVTSGSAPDLGALEYVSITDPPTPPSPPKTPASPGNIKITDNLFIIFQFETYL